MIFLVGDQTNPTPSDGGGKYNFFSLHISSFWVRCRLHAKFQLPGRCNPYFFVGVGVGGWVGGWGGEWVGCVENFTVPSKHPVLRLIYSAFVI